LLEEGRVYLSRALAIIEREYGPDHPTVGLIKSNIGVIYSKQGRFEEAIPFYRAAAENARMNGGDENPDLANPLSSLGHALWNLGEIDEAREVIERAAVIMEKTMDPYDTDLATGLINHGYMLYEQGRFEEARARYDRALEIREKRLGRDHFDTAQALFYLAELNGGQNNVPEALELALEAEGIARRQFQQVAASLTENEALAYELVRRSGTNIALECLDHLEGDELTVATRRVWDQLIRSRAMVMDEVAFRKRALATHAGPEVETRMATFAHARDELAGLIAAGAGGEEDYLDKLREARSRRIEAERGLAELSIEFRRRMERREAGLEDVVKALPPETSLVAYFHYKTTVSPVLAAEAKQETGQEPGSYEKAEVKSHFTVFALADRESEPVVVSLEDGDEIEALIQTWKLEAGARPPVVPLAARQAEARYKKTGEALRRAVWDPVADAVDLSERVIVVPDGSLHMVSFGALPAGESEYLVEKGPALHYVSAERDLIRTGGVSAGGTGLLALGGADFEGAPGGPPATATRSAEPMRAASCDGLASMTFSPIHSSRAEAEQVAKLWKQETRQQDGEAALLTGKNASEAALRRSAPGNRVVHLATHGFFALEACAPAEPSAPRQGLYAARDHTEALRVLEDPFLLAGLALAGANTRTNRDAPAADDGILTAEEVATLDLSGVEWVVLSACETGVGKVQTGEGVLGLRRAFETAGAGTLVMSLWAVDDEATRSWMEHLYRHRLAGASTLEAVRSASAETIAARRDEGLSTHPFFWGAFVAVGDWR
ncbi:MAG: CHAT domain-containing tetratricopeptide repeat protein, partial [Acidobacteriota bacterium]|nr:CHAT domain-containing tetratricopeptide repeat protein [Acidobacteriota bacterium]